MVFRPNLSGLSHVCTFVLIISLVLFILPGCKPLSQPLDNTAVEQEEEPGSVEAETVTQEEEIIEETGEDDTEKEPATEETREEKPKDTAAEDTETTITINVYYIDEQAQYLVGEERTITGKNKVELITAAFTEILREPVQGNLYNLIPEGTSLINAEFVDDYAFLNLTPEFVENRVNDSLVDNLVIKCIAATMTEIPEVRGVIFKVDWEKIDVYGSLDIKNPVTRDEELIKP